MRVILRSGVSQLLALSLGSLVIGFFGAVYVLGVASKQSGTPTIDIARPEQTQKRSFTIAALGDMIPHDSINAQAKTNAGYDYKPFYSAINKTYREADVVFCNVESPIAGDELGVSGYPEFNAPGVLAQDMVSVAGCKLVNMANNHIFDKGQRGIDISREAWQKAGAVTAGAYSTAEQRDQVAYVTVQGKKIAFVAFADFSNKQGFERHSLNLLSDTEVVTRLMNTARQTADLVIVSAHWGDEDATTVSAAQYNAAKQLAELGADVIIGTGPHVLQSIEMIKHDTRQTLVLYSIGNSLQSQLQKNELTSIIPQLTVTEEAGTLRVSALRIQPTFVAYDWSATAKQQQDLAARKNISYDTLHKQSARIPGMFSDASYDERLSFIKDTLGSAVSYTLVE